MTTIDLLQRYPTHKDCGHHGKASVETKASNSNKPERTTPDPHPSQHFDTKTKLLHEMLDEVVKDLANNQSEPASRWDGTLWRSPLRPRSQSPAYSEISDSFESPARIEHCTNHLLSTPISPTSTHSKGLDGWPLGIEVAMNEFHRGRLSTPILQEDELPNRLIVRKQQQQTPDYNSSGNHEGEKTVRCKKVPCEQHCDSHCQLENASLKPLAFQKQQSNLPLQQQGEWQGWVDSASLKPMVCQAQSFTSPQRSDCRYQEKSENIILPDMQQQSCRANCSDILYVPTLLPRKYGEDSEDKILIRNTSTDLDPDLDPALANSNVLMGSESDNTGRKRSIFDSYGREPADRQIRTNSAYLLHKESRQTALSDTLPRNTEIHSDTHHAELRINMVDNAINGNLCSFGELGATENIEMDSVHHKVSFYNTYGDSRNDSLQAIKLPISEDSKVDTDSDAGSWKTSGPLEDIVEENEDFLKKALTRDGGRPQHLFLGSAEPPNSDKSSKVVEKLDSMLAIQGPLKELSIQLPSRSRVLPTLELTINPSSKPQPESTKPSTYQLSGAKSSQLVPSATTLTKLKEPTHKEARLSPTALGELRKIAESQSHFQTGPDLPEDQYQADIHPLLRSKTFSRPSFQPSQKAHDSALRYIFDDDDSEGHEIEREDSAGHQIHMKPCTSIEPKSQNAESLVTHTSMKEYEASQLGKMEEVKKPKHPCKKNTPKALEPGYTGSFTPQTTPSKALDDTAFVSSKENATPSSSFLPATLSSTMNGFYTSAVGSPDVLPSYTVPPNARYCRSLAMGSPAAYNSWASTPHKNERGKSCSTSFSEVTFPNSMVPTSNTTSGSNSPNSHGMTMTPASSSGQLTGSSPTSGGSKLTPNSSFGHFAGLSPSIRGPPVTPSSSLDNATANKNYRRSVSFSSMFARYQKARYPNIPTTAPIDSTLFSKESVELDQARAVANDPFTSAHDDSTAFSLNLKAHSKDDLAAAPTRGAEKFNTPTRRSSGRFSLHRRSLSISGRPNTNDGLERALSTLIFNPRRSRPLERSHSISPVIDTTGKPDGRGRGYRRSLSIASNHLEQKWEIAPSPTPLCLRDEFSMRYGSEQLEAHDHYTTRKDALQGMKHGLKRVFGR